MQADGRRLGTLVSGGYPSLGPQSPSGKWIVYWSDREIPNEPFTYVANVSTGSSKRLARKYLQAHCWRSDDTVLLDDYSPERGSMLVLSGVRTGTQRIVLRRAGLHVVPPCSASGRFLLLTNRVRTTLELLDIRTGDRRRLRTPLAGRRYYNEAQLSPDGQRVAYTVDRLRTISGRTTGVPGGVAYVHDLTTGRTRVVQRAKGQRIYFLWSPSGDRLLLRSTRHRRSTKAERGGEGCQAWSLFLVDVERGTSKPLVANAPHYPDHLWAPDGKAFAYSTGRTVYVVPLRGLAQKFGHTAGYGLFGWSPDGHELGLVRAANRARIAILNTRTGAIRTILREKRRDAALEVTWLR
jgi:Tol biopolymer transport system component